MAVNPLVAQGDLVRVRASVNWNNFATLNVSASYLAQEGILLALEGMSTLLLPTMTGTVTSREPYMMIAVTMHLLKTQSLADAYKVQMELDSRLGDGTVRPDVSTGISPYDVYNCAIESVRELNFSGRDPGWVVTCRGFYIVNNSLFN